MDTDKLGSDKLGSDKLGSDKLGSDKLGSDKLATLNEELVFAPPHSDVSFAGVEEKNDAVLDIVLEGSENGFVEHHSSVTVRVESSESDEVGPDALHVGPDALHVGPADALRVVSDIVVDAGKEALEELYRVLIVDVKGKMREIDLGTIRPSTLPVLIGIVMEAIERTIIKGNAQKVFAMRIVSELIDELPEGPEKVFMKATGAGGGVEATIELVVAASRGDLNVNQVADVALKTCAAPCFDYIMSKFRTCRVPRCKVPRFKVPRFKVPRFKVPRRSRDKKSE
jgi:hypothetical protein